MRNPFNYRLFLGIGLIAAGVLFFLNQNGTIHLNFREIVSDYWPLILIFFGLKGLADQRRYGHGGSYSFIGSLFLMVIGLLFLSRNLGFIDITIGELFQYLIPIGLILIGLKIIFSPFGVRKPENPDNPQKSDKVQELTDENTSKINESGHQWSYDRWNRDGSRRHHKWKHNWSHPHHWNHHPSDPLQTNWHNKSGFIGDLHLGQDYFELHSMNISHFIGDTILDLTKAQISTGVTELIISAFIGDVKIFVPTDMDIEVSVISNSFLGDITVFGRHESGFMKNMKVESPQFVESEKKIIVTVNMFIGDVNVLRVG